MKPVNKQRPIISRGHEVLQGPVRVSKQVVVGGNLTVHGDLICDGDIFCLGHIDVKGNLTAGGVLVAGAGVEVQGDLNAGYTKLSWGSEQEDDFNEFADTILLWMAKRPKENDEIFESRLYLADEDVIMDIATVWPHALEVGGSFYCHGRIDAHGAMIVAGVLESEGLDASGCFVDAANISIDGDLDCGDLGARQEIEVWGDLHCVSVEARRLKVWDAARVEESVILSGPDSIDDDDLKPHDFHNVNHLAEAGHDPFERVKPEQLIPCLQAGDLKAGSVTAAGSVRVQGGIECDGYLRAHRSITAGGPISTGKQYGILAGIGLPRDAWPKKGFVCALSKPKRILTGVYRPLGRRRANSVLKPAALPSATRKPK